MKKMIILSALALALCLFALPFTQASAETIYTSGGSAIVNGLYAKYGSATNNATFQIFTSNVSISDVHCKVTVYDNDGSDITSAGSVYTSASSGGGWVVIASGTGEFDLPANGSRTYLIDVAATMPNCMCYAKIEWWCDNPGVSRALLASAREVIRIGDSWATNQTPVNGGLIF